LEKTSAASRFETGGLFIWMLDVRLNTEFRQILHKLVTDITSRQSSDNDRSLREKSVHKIGFEKWRSGVAQNPVTGLCGGCTRLQSKQIQMRQFH